MEIPSEEECLALLTRNSTPSNVIEHARAVAVVAKDVAEKLISKGIAVNKELVVAAALLHDIERIKKDHVREGAQLLRRMGYPEVADVVEKHGLYELRYHLHPKTVEEKIVFYADKRVKGSKIVSLQERFEDLKNRYGGDYVKELAYTKQIEKELTTQ